MSSNQLTDGYTCLFNRALQLIHKPVQAVVPGNSRRKEFLMQMNHGRLGTSERDMSYTLRSCYSRWSKHPVVASVTTPS